MKTSCPEPSARVAARTAAENATSAMMASRPKSKFDRDTDPPLSKACGLPSSEREVIFELEPWAEPFVPKAWKSPQVRLSQKPHSVRRPGVGSFFGGLREQKKAVRSLARAASRRANRPGERRSWPTPHRFSAAACSAPH